MIENYLRPRYQKFAVDNIAKRCSQYVTPNQLTVISCLTGISILPALVFKQIGIAIVLLLCSGFLDTLDGTIARLQGSTTNFGTVLDILSDRLVEATIIIGLFLVAPEQRGLLTLCMLTSVLLCVSSFLVVGIFTPNASTKSFYYSPGIMERAEAFIFFGLMMVFPTQFTWLAILFSALVLLTACIRVYQFRSFNLSNLALPLQQVRQKNN